MSTKMQIGPFIAQQRKKYGLTQEELAIRLKVSRPTLVMIEKGKRELTATNLQDLKKIFNTSVELLLEAREPKEVGVAIKKSQTIAPDSATARISVPQERLDIFKEVLLYILTKVGGKPNVGETVLYKLLYFIDFDYYEKYERQLIGAIYIKNHYGPTPIEFKKVIEQMEKSGAIEKVTSKFFKFEQKKYLPLRKPDLSKLSGQELELIDDVLAKLSDATASELSEYSHRDIPWEVAEMGKPISYESVFYRSDPYAARSYESL